MLISAFWLTSWQFSPNFFLDIEKFYQVLSTFQISDQLDHSNRNYREGGAEYVLPWPYKSAQSLACLGLNFDTSATQMRYKLLEIYQLKDIISFSREADFGNF